MANPLQRKKRLALLRIMKEKAEKVVENVVDITNDAVEVVKEEIKELILPKEAQKEEKKEEEAVKVSNLDEETSKVVAATTVRKVLLKKSE